jgi:hypothetical protein
VSNGMWHVLLVQEERLFLDFFWWLVNLSAGFFLIFPREDRHLYFYMKFPGFKMPLGPLKSFFLKPCFFFFKQGYSQIKHIWEQMWADPTLWGSDSVSVLRDAMQQFRMALFPLMKWPNQLFWSPLLLRFWFANILSVGLTGG